MKDTIRDEMKVRIIEKICRAYNSNVPEYEILNKMRDVVNSIPYFNIREKAEMFKVVKRAVLLIYSQKGEMYLSQIRRFDIDINKINEHSNSRQRGRDLDKKMKYHRAMDKGVFYMTSIHSNPAKDHAKYQGKIYVDRYWRNTLKDKDDIKKVGSYIRNHNTVTVQEICWEPVYMITRPYCKHYFIALDTDEVLKNGVKKIIRNHPEVQARTHNVDYRVKHRRLENRIKKVIKKARG